LNGSPAGKPPPVVLVVEDEPLLRMLAVEVVEEAGFIAIEARNADEAFMMLESRTDITLLSLISTCPAAWAG
jgi:two-component system, response regulator PdtaR